MLVGYGRWVRRGAKGKMRRDTGARSDASTPPPVSDTTKGTRKVDIRLSGKGNSNSHGAGPVYYNHLDD